MLTHGNIVSNVVATQGWIGLDPSDRLLSFLPLSHVFERVVLFRCLYDGVSIYFAETMTSVARDLQRVKPTVMTGVPACLGEVPRRDPGGARQARGSAPKRWPTGRSASGTSRRGFG